MSGPVRRTRARSTGTMVEVWRSAEFADEQTAPWVTVCEHSSICEHDTRKLAIDWSAEPEEWCETGCRKAFIERHPDQTRFSLSDVFDDSWSS